MKSLWALTLTIMAAAALPAAARADVTAMLKNAEGVSTGGRLQVLPPLSRPRPARQIQQVKCDMQSPTLGADVCLWVFDKVAAGHVLQIDKLNCTGSPGAILFNTQTKAQAPFVIGFLTPPYNGVYFSFAVGPYYFRAGETPKIAGNGLDSSTTGICSISGTLWTAN